MPKLITIATPTYWTDQDNIYRIIWGTYERTKTRYTKHIQYKAPGRNWQNTSPTMTEHYLNSTYPQCDKHGNIKYQYYTEQQDHGYTVIIYRITTNGIIEQQLRKAHQKPTYWTKSTNDKQYLETKCNKINMNPEDMTNNNFISNLENESHLYTTQPNTLATEQWHGEIAYISDNTISIRYKVDDDLIEQQYDKTQLKHQNYKIGDQITVNITVTIDKTEEQEWAEIEANAPTNAEIETVKKYLNETTQKPNTELPTINNTLNNITELRESRTPITELLQHYNDPEIQEAITKEIDKEILKDLKQPPNLIQDIINTYKEYDQQNDHEPKTIDYEALRAILIIKLKNLNTPPNPQRNYINEANQIIQAQQNKIEELEQQAQITLDLATQSSGRSIGGELHFEVAHALQQLNNKIQQLEQQLKETTKERDEYYLKTKPTNTRITELEQELKELNEYYGNLQYRNLHPFNHID